MVVPIQRRWDEDPVKAFFLRPIEVIDSPNEGHEMLAMILLPLNHFRGYVKATLNALFEFFEFIEFFGFRLKRCERDKRE
jgi:hypothetical protein